MIDPKNAEYEMKKAVRRKQEKDIETEDVKKRRLELRAALTTMAIDLELMALSESCLSERHEDSIGTAVVLIDDIIDDIDDDGSLLR